MDTNSIYDAIGETEMKKKVVKKSFYTEMVKEEDNYSLAQRIKQMIIKWLS